MHGRSYSFLGDASHRTCGLIGTIVHSIGFGEIELIENGMIVYDCFGVIQNVFDLSKVALKDIDVKIDGIIDCSGKLIVPGFVDAHCHAPQYVFTGTGMDLPLLAWLEKYTFPSESRFSDIEFARRAYKKAIKRHMKSGTTFASYFATLHNDASKVLVEVINEVGQRAFVGKVSMDRNCPDFYIENTDDGCRDAEDFVRCVLSQTEVGNQFLKFVDNSNDVGCSNQVIPFKPSKNDTDELFSQEISEKANSSAISWEPQLPHQISFSVPAFSDLNSPGKRLRSISMASSSEQLGDLARNGSSSSREGFNGPSVATTLHSITQTNSDVLSSGEVARKRPRTISVSSVSDFSKGFLTSSSSSSSSNPEDVIYNDQAISSSSMQELNADLLNTHFHSSKSLLNKSYTPLVMPCITPRFVPTCTPKIMTKLGELSRIYGLPVQSHMSESPGEIAWVAELHVRLNL